MRHLQILLVFGLLISCNQLDNQTVLKNYMDGYYNHGFDDISSMIADSVTIIDVPNYSVTYTKDEYRMIFQWDSVFQTNNEIEILGQTDSTVDILEKRYSKRFEFLEHNPLIMKQRIHFKQGVITTIENREYLNFDVPKWTSNRDSLVSWIDINHPELSGFINDLTKKGAEDYMKAIELYKNAL